jgi:hypothetical protein
VTVITGGLISLEFAAAGVKYAPASVGQAANAARDADLTVYVQAATPVIEDIVGGPVAQVTKTVKFNGGDDEIILHDSVSSVTSVVEVGNTLNAATDYIFDPVSNIIIGGTPVYPRIFYPGRLAMTVTYVTGFAPIPMTIQLATRELVRFWIQQGNQSQRPGYGDQVESLAYTPQGFAVPKRVMELLAPYRKLGGFA